MSAMDNFVQPVKSGSHHLYDTEHTQDACYLMLQKIVPLFQPSPPREGKTEDLCETWDPWTSGIRKPSSLLQPPSIVPASQSSVKVC